MQRSPPLVGRFGPWRVPLDGWRSRDRNLQARTLAEVRRSRFDDFFTTKAAGSGPGLSSARAQFRGDSLSGAKSNLVADRVLRCELVAHGAPDDLVRRARRAIADESEHARMTCAQAAHLGLRTKPFSGEQLPVRLLVDIAIENATEGCVREAYAAMVAHLQAARAGSPQLRADFARIASDETEHAALAIDCDAWLATRLSEDERARVARA